MAKLVALNSRKKSSNPFARFFQWFKSLDPFARFMVVTLALVVAVTPEVVTMTLTNENEAAGTGSISINPSSGTFTPGQQFTVTIAIDGGGQAFNAASADISVTNLTINSNSVVITPDNSGGCKFNAWGQIPTSSDPSFAGTFLGGSDTACTLYTMTVTAGSAGPASINFLSNGPEGNHIVSAADSSELLNSTIPGNYTVASATPTDTPVVPTDTPILPTNTPVIPTDTPVLPTDTPGVGGPTATPTPLPRTATMNFVPDIQNVQTGTPFNVDLVIDGNGQTFNTANADITVSGLTITKVTPGSCNFSWAIKTPSTQDPSFVGSILGGNTSKCTVYTLTLQGDTAGVGQLTINQSTATVVSDVTHTQLLNTVQSGSYQITAPGVTAPPLPTNAPAPAVGGPSGGSSNGGGNSACTSIPPHSAPFVYEVDIRGNVATVYAVPALDPYDSYTISYGEALNDSQYAYTFAQSHATGALKFTIGGLKRSTYYSFKIHANNGCRPGEWSSSFTAKTNFWPFSVSKYYAYQQAKLRQLGKNGKTWWQFWK